MLPTTLIGTIFTLIGFFCVGIFFWWIGRFLRKKGFSSELDAIDKHVTKWQSESFKILGSFCMALISLGRALSYLPFLGSRKQRQRWNDMYEIQKKIKEDKPKD